MATPLQEVARRVNWYADPQQLLANVSLFLCRVMARGGVEDLAIAQRHFSPEDFRRAILNAPPAWLAAVVLGLPPGTDGPNKYGNDQRGKMRTARPQ